MAASDKRLSVADLSGDQREVYEAMVSWSTGNDASLGSSGGGLFDDALPYQPPSTRLLTVGGLGGVGKSTLVGVFAANTKLLCAYVTFTGRASSILNRKLKAAGAATTDMLCPSDDMRMRNRGSNRFYDFSLSRNSGPGFCGTIHRLLYRPVIDPKTEELTGWVKRTELDRDYDLIVVDEASMVGGEMLGDLQQHGVPILAVGDHGQLPPVMDSGELMKNPMLRLEKIHRQALGSPIIRYAHSIRETGSMAFGGDVPNGELRFGRRGDVEKVLGEAYSKVKSMLDVGILCWTNKSRCQLNGTARRALGLKGRPQAGEVVICLKNKPPVYNGMRGLLVNDTSVGQKPWLLDAEIEFPDEGLTPELFSLCAPQFCREKTFGSVEELRERGLDVYSMGAAGNFFDFGSCLTTHKAQGSSFSHAIVYMDRPIRPDDPEFRKWAYTSVTRAADRLTVLL